MNILANRCTVFFWKLQIDVRENLALFFSNSTNFAKLLARFVG